MKGTVETILWRSTILQTRMNQQLVIQNEKVALSEILNYSKNDGSIGLAIYHKFIFFHPDHNPEALSQIIESAIMLTEPVGDRRFFTVCRVRVVDFDPKGLKIRVSIDSTSDNKTMDFSNLLKKFISYFPKWG